MRGYDRAVADVEYLPRRRPRHQGEVFATQNIKGTCDPRFTGSQMLADCFLMLNLQPFDIVRQEGNRVESFHKIVKVFLF